MPAVYVACNRSVVAEDPRLHCGLLCEVGLTTLLLMISLALLHEVELFNDAGSLSLGSRAFNILASFRYVVSG